MPARYTGTNTSYTGANCPGFVSNQLEGVEKCIDDSLSSQKPSRMSSLSTVMLAVLSFPVVFISKSKEPGNPCCTLVSLCFAW